MTIKDLEYIHKLLTEEATRRKNAKELLREATYQAEELKAENFESLNTEYNKASKKYYEAYNVLQNFEAEEWK